jgi:hypothetical protein
MENKNFLTAVGLCLPLLPELSPFLVKLNMHTLRILGLSLTTVLTALKPCRPKGMTTRM